MQIAAPSFSSGIHIPRSNQRPRLSPQPQFGCDSCGGAGGGGHLMHIIAGGTGLLTLASVLWIALRGKAKPKNPPQPPQPPSQTDNTKPPAPGEQPSGGKS